MYFDNLTTIHYKATTNILTTTEPSNSTETLPAWSGFLFLIGCSFFWGSNYLPVKQCKYILSLNKILLMRL